MNPKYPMYIVSKGRADVGTTRKAFDKMGVPYKIVVEEQERDEYAKYVGEDKVIVLPQKYKDEYDTFDNLGQTKSIGPGAARNFAWDHSISIGAKAHWVFDDNVSGFCRLNNNRRIPVADGTIFRVMEDFCDRYENLVIGGPQYRFFANDSTNKPYCLNTRVYSMLLIKNHIDYRWRGRYNEDTDLSLRVLKDGYCTIQFYAFLGDKLGTQKMKGGNSEAFYFEEGTKNKSQMLVDMHPDVSKLVWKFNRWHHEVDYTPFKRNKLKMKEGLLIPDRVNNYGMVLKRVANEV